MDGYLMEQSLTLGTGRALPAAELDIRVDRGRFYWRCPRYPGIADHWLRDKGKAIP